MSVSAGSGFGSAPSAPLQDARRLAVNLAAELEACWAEWREPFYDGAWEHLGDAERDARVLVAGIKAMERGLQAAERSAEGASTAPESESVG